MEINKVVVFNTGKEEYALPIHNVISIEKMQATNEIPNMPNYLKGIVKIREELIPVLDMNVILYNRDHVSTDKTRMIVVNTEALQVGIIVDDAKEIIDIPSESIKQINLFAYQQTPYFSGIANLEGRLLTIIEPNKLLESLEGISEIKEEVVSQSN